MKTSFTILLILLICTSSYAQYNTGRKFHAFSNTMVLSVEGGATIANFDYSGVKPDALGRVSLEYFFPTYSLGAFGFRIFALGGYLAEDDPEQVPSVVRTDFTSFGGGFVFALSIQDAVFPYLTAGAAYTHFNPLTENGVPLPGNASELYNKNEVNYLAELGFRIMLADNLSFNINGGAQLSPNDNLDDYVAGSNNDLFFFAMAGISASFFGEKDSDNDGIPDSKDACPNTVPGTSIDEFGCPKDTDKDGVPDTDDKCPGTAPNVKVDKSGCPYDADEDGIPDYLDVCSGTPKGVVVDDLGCPSDQDQDGVPDYLDICPDTEEKVPVDRNGCPVDSDQDGVPDAYDKCPGTPKGDKVDEKGCTIFNEPDVQEVVLSSGTNFAFGKAELLPSAYQDLDKVVRAAKESPGSRWRIEGHTDNIGSDKANKYLSKARAESVLSYFISSGLESSRFEVVGLGKDFPVADNSTEQGRAQNRRVRIVRLN